MIYSDKSSSMTTVLLVYLAFCLEFSRIVGKVTISTDNLPSTDFLNPIIQCQQLASQEWPSVVKTKVLLNFKNYTDLAIMGGSIPLGWENLNTSAGLHSVPSAVAKAVTGVDMRPHDYDLMVNLNARADWYIGISSNIPSHQIDLVSVCLHEVYHGLFLYGSTKPSSVDARNRFEQFIVVETEDGDCPILSYQNQPSRLNRALTGNSLWFRTADKRITRLYAPNQWIQGSSVHHIDDRNGISFMTPYVIPGLATRTISPAVLAVQNVMLNISEIPPKLCGTDSLYEPIVVNDSRIWMTNSVFFHLDFWLGMTVISILLRARFRRRLFN